MKIKTCFKCKEEKLLEHFYVHKQMADGHLNKCKECCKKDVKINYKNNVDYYRKYEILRYRTQENRIVSTKYNGIKNRCSGRWRKGYTVEGMKPLTLKSFKRWWIQNKDKYDELYKEWEMSGFIRKKAPSIDRINNKKGYSPKNMQWITLSENCKKKKV